MEDPRRTYPPYRALRFIVRYGDALAILIGGAPLVVGVAAYLGGLSVALIVVGFGGSAFLFLIMRSYVELVRVIVDTLLPKP
jgi:hypothetical protein